MYHDQGLPVLKYAGFGAAVNVTLGLPIIRTSVDHGTAFDIAGTGAADPGSLKAALAHGGRNWPGESSPRARKRFGQHFLTDPGVIDAIVDGRCNAPKPDDIIVEIGPGHGAITEPLARRAGHLHCHRARPGPGVGAADRRFAERDNVQRDSRS